MKRQAVEVIIFAGTLFLLLAVGFAFNYKAPLATEVMGKPVNAPTTLKITFARSPAEQAKGLSGRTNFADDEGMLFVFNKPAVRCMWAKGMLFDTDVFFLDDAGNLINREFMKAGSTDPHCSKSPTRQILETKSR